MYIRWKGLSGWKAGSCCSTATRKQILRSNCVNAVTVFDRWIKNERMRSKL
jgi:predicted nucleic acid-binding Zn ribbon protein